VKKWWLWVVMLSIISLLGGFFLVRPLSWPTVYAGVAMEGVDVGGRSREELAQMLTLWQKEYNEKKVTVYYGDTAFKLDAQSIDYAIDVDATLDEVWNYGRRGSWWERLKNIHSALQEGYRVPLHIRYNEGKLDNLVDTWKDSVERQPRNASLSLLTGGIIPQEPGRKLEAEVLRPMVLQAFKKAGTTDAVPLPVTLLYPEITVADIASTGIREVMGTFSTSFNAQDGNRTSNIKLATSKINGYILYPGKTFSFNEIVGPREKSFGFKEALELVDGEFVPGIGGGICQVSSTLYNAALLANLEIVERYNHSKPLGYVGLGRDATVAFGVLDFKFANNTAAPVMIMAEIEGNKLLVGIFGQQRLAESVEILSKDKQVLPPVVVKQPDQELYLGETKLDRQGKPGYEITTVRIVRLQGREIKREILSKDRYLPDDTIVKVGAQLPPFVKSSKQN
jgi:vancomycin resistance protein YoaR